MEKFTKLDEEDDNWEEVIMDGMIINAKDHSTSKGPHERAIVHIDIDCFYAQVEMIKDPELKTKPLGIKQKNLVVTCNYVARELGVEKLMCIKEAIQICPQIVLVCGEDLTDYREASYKVTRILEEFSPLVERLGFDENFIDVTSLVHSHQRTDIIGNGAELLISGHIYLEGSGALPEPCSCGCYSRLQEASHIAQEIRNRIYQELGLTTCAGIAHNKLLAKLVCGSHKPNQQTTLFPQHVGHLLKSLNTVKDIPGIGSAMYKNLSEMNINLVGDLQLCDLSSLEETVGSDQARRLKNLSFGVDETPVVLSGKPQSHSLEDTFRKCSTVSECRQRLGLLLQRLLKRIVEDGRVPHVVKLTIRKYYHKLQQSSREIRQCGLPQGLMNKLFTGTNDEELVHGKVVDILMKLFHKMVDESNPFHLTLLGISFTKFIEQNNNSQSILNFFTPKSSGISSQEPVHEDHFHSRRPLVSNHSFTKMCVCSDDEFNSSTFHEKQRGRDDGSSPGPKRLCVDKTVFGEKKLSNVWRSFFNLPDAPLSFVETGKSVKKSLLTNQFLKVSSSSDAHRTCVLDGEHHNADQSALLFSKSNVTDGLPLGIDYSTFKELPYDLQQELLFSWKLNPQPSFKSHEEQSTAHRFFNLSTSCVNPSDKNTYDKLASCPTGVDKTVFAELPTEVQAELMTQWKVESSRKRKSKTNVKTLDGYFKKKTSKQNDLDLTF